jgi:hypothetical protein
MPLESTQTVGLVQLRPRAYSADTTVQSDPFQSAVGNPSNRQKVVPMKLTSLSTALVAAPVWLRLQLVPFHRSTKRWSFPKLSSDQPAARQKLALGQLTA